MNASRGGRRPGENNTRQLLLDEAVQQFAAQGFRATSLRAITKAVGVDVSMVRHFFGSKEGLYREAVFQQLKLDHRILPILDGEPSTLGERLTKAYVAMWEQPETANLVRALFRSALDAESEREHFQHMFSVQFQRAAGHLPEGVDPKHLALAASQLMGTCVVRYLLHLDPLASMSTSEFIEYLSPSIQAGLES